MEPKFPTTVPATEDKHQPETDPTIIIEREFSRYILPDDAIDLSAWLRDGLIVYNLFTLMKPAFYAMLRELGGKFEFSMKEAADRELGERVRIRPLDKYGEKYELVMEDRIDPANVNTNYSLKEE